MATVRVKAHTRPDGTRVKAHTRETGRRRMTSSQAKASAKRRFPQHAQGGGRVKRAIGKVKASHRRGLKLIEQEGKRRGVTLKQMRRGQAIAAGLSGPVALGSTVAFKSPLAGFAVGTATGTAAGRGYIRLAARRNRKRGMVPR